MVTTTLFNIIHSELIKKGFNEFVNDEGELVFFDDEYQFVTKIFSYDEEVSEIINWLFNGIKLDDPIHDEHFKKTFIYRFVNREINRQTIEAFKFELLSVFMANKNYINMVYSNLDDYITQKNTSNNDNEQVNNQSNTSTNITDNRSAFAELPQSHVNLDVNNSVMNSANDNTISKNKQVNSQENEGNTSNTSYSENRTYQLDELFKSNGVLENILNIFDVKCFLQIW